jgi:hypothetical protein
MCFLQTCIQDGAETSLKFWALNKFPDRPDRRNPGEYHSLKLRVIVNNTDRLTYFKFSSIYVHYYCT